MRRSWSASLVLTAAFAATPAGAYTLRSTESGASVRWGDAAVELLADPSLRAIDKDGGQALRRAVTAWSAPLESMPGITVVAGEIDDIGYHVGRPNKCTVRYVPGGWEPAGDALAVTVVTFTEEGLIIDADIVVNGGAGRMFGIVDAEPNAKGQTSSPQHDALYDLQNVLTHELGHVLGLGEEDVLEEATMYPRSERGETRKRDLDADDEAGAAALYANDEEEAAAPAGLACALPAGGPAPRSSVAVAALVIALAALARTARKGRHTLFAGLAALALTAPAAQVEGHADELAQGAPAIVVGAAPRWQGGLVVTRLAVARTGCATGDRGCDEPVIVDAWGGTIDGLTQIVGGATIPSVGASVDLASLEHHPAR